MKRLIPFAVLIACLAAATPLPCAAADPAFGTYWHDGKAELDGYRLTVDRYGAARRGRAVAIFVTEPFSGSRHVKLDDPSKTPADAVDALKLNLSRDFQTGIYDYHTMLSVFSQSRDFSPLKIAFSSSEWCGQVYEEVNFWSGFIQHKLFSYFEGESTEGKQPSPTSGVAEDNLLILLRGLNGPYLQPGMKRTVPFLPSAFYRRLAHQPTEWSKATIERSIAPESVTVPAGRFIADVYVVRPEGGRVGRIHVERAYPHRIVRWAWTAPAASAPMGGTDMAELTGTTRLDYWRTHNPGDEKLLDSIGLGVAVK
jgi:hypothetical protein